MGTKTDWSPTKYHLLCFAEERNAYWFVMKRGCVNNDHELFLVNCLFKWCLKMHVRKDRRFWRKSSIRIIRNEFNLHVLFQSKLVVQVLTGLTNVASNIPLLLSCVTLASTDFSCLLTRSFPRQGRRGLLSNTLCNMFLNTLIERNVHFNKDPSVYMMDMKFVIWKYYAFSVFQKTWYIFDRGQSRVKLWDSTFKMV